MAIRRPATLTLASLVLFAGVVCAQDNAADAKRLIEVLQLEPGDVVAEIGAGSGELTISLAKHVAPDGRVFTSELGGDRLQRLRAAVEKAGVGNVTVIEGQEQVANLPDECCDALFMRNVYHHFGAPSSMNASFLRALKPGGRIAVIDFAPPKQTTADPGKRGENGSHGITDETLAQELTAAGFEVLPEETQMLSERGERRRSDRWFIVVAVKPKR
jgi:ubiquinone/menaquinone biosynthesis C-methylase UbiE